MRHQFWPLYSCALALIAIMPAPAAAAEEAWEIDFFLPGQAYGELSAVDVVATQTWVGGTEVDPETGRAAPVVRFLDGVLVRLASPEPDPPRDVRLADLAVVGDRVLVVANTTTDSGASQPVIHRYSRTQVGESSVLPGPAIDTYGTLNALTPLPDGRARIVGATGPTPALTRTLILEEDHGGWQRIPSPSPGTGENQLNAVRAGWAVGHYTTSDAPSRSHALVLRDEGPGVGWTQVPVPDAGKYLNELTSVAVSASGDVFVAGWSTNAENADPGQRTAVAMRWNRSTWEPLRPSNATVTQFNDVTVNPDGTVLFAGYTTTFSVESASLEKWTGDPRLRPIRIDQPVTDEDSYPASGVTAIDAGTAGDGPYAVGWVLRSDQAVLGASLRPTP